MMPTRSMPVTTYNSFGQPTGTTTMTWDVTTEQVNADQLKADLTASLAANRTFLAIPNLTVGLSVNAQVQALSRQNIVLTRLVLALLDATD